MLDDYESILITSRRLSPTNVSARTAPLRMSPPSPIPCPSSSAKRPTFNVLPTIPTMRKPRAFARRMSNVAPAMPPQRLLQLLRQQEALVHPLPANLAQPALLLRLLPLLPVPAPLATLQLQMSSSSLLVPSQLSSWHASSSSSEWGNCLCWVASHLVDYSVPVHGYGIGQIEEADKSKNTQRSWLAYWHTA
jgi:hypothetical protein